MSVNPFETPASSSTPGTPASSSHPGRGRMKTRMLWFLLGFACSWISWSTIAYIRMRPRDMTHSWSEEMREMAPPWMKEARAVVLGRFVLVAPADSSSANAMVYPVESPSTGALFFDEDSDCHVDEMMVADAKQRTWSISLDANNREANSFSFSSGFAFDSVTYEDGNVDGQYDTCFRLGKEDPDRVSVWIDSNWHQSVLHDVKRYVEIDGAQVEVKLDKGVWQRVSTD